MLSINISEWSEGESVTEFWMEDWKEQQKTNVCI